MPTTRANSAYHTACAYNMYKCLFFHLQEGGPLVSTSADSYYCIAGGGGYFVMVLVRHIWELSFFTGRGCLPDRGSSIFSLPPPVYMPHCSHAAKYSGPPMSAYAKNGPPLGPGKKILRRWP